MSTLCPPGHDVDGVGGPEWSSVIPACPPISAGARTGPQAHSGAAVGEAGSEDAC